MMSLSNLVKTKRKAVGLTQEEFADRAGVALTVVRKIEQGKTNLNLDKVNMVLKMFGSELKVEETERFRPQTFSAVLGNLFDRGFIDRTELEALLEEHISGKKFNATNLLKDYRPRLVSNEIKDIMERNGLYDADRPDYLRL